MLAPPELKKIHPLGKSPVITDGDVTVAESGKLACPRVHAELACKHRSSRVSNTAFEQAPLWSILSIRMATVA